MPAVRIGSGTLFYTNVKPLFYVLKGLNSVDRKSKYLLMQLSPRKTSQAVLDTLLKMYKNIQKKTHTITCDNGAEFSKFRLIEKKLKTKMYFCNPIIHGKEERMKIQTV